MTDSDTGYVLFNVRTKNSAIPLGNASVTVFDKDGNAVRTTFTDGGGTTERLPLPAVSGQLTYYYAVVSRNGYYNVKIENIPSADSLTAIQNVEMFPVSDYADEVRPGTFDITEPRGVQYAELL